MVERSDLCKEIKVEGLPGDSDLQLEIMSLRGSQGNIWEKLAESNFLSYGKFPDFE